MNFSLAPNLLFMHRDFTTGQIIPEKNPSLDTFIVYMYTLYTLSGEVIPEEKIPSQSHVYIIFLFVRFPCASQSAYLFEQNDPNLSLHHTIDRPIIRGRTTTTTRDL